jgi:predicted nuclease of predicted toxin-antitoxin system
VRFLIDMPLSPMLAQWLSENGHDAAHATTLGLDRAPDTEILLRAKEEGRIVVTADLDYPRLLALSAAIEPSLVLFRGGNWADDEIVARLATLLDSVSEADFKRIIFVVEPKRIRRRHLPIG